jgi:cytochrome P450
VDAVSVQSQRITGPEGHVIAGRFVPGKTLVSVAHMATYRSPDNFRDPDKFAPERWMGDEPVFTTDTTIRILSADTIRDIRIRGNFMTIRITRDIRG